MTAASDKSVSPTEETGQPPPGVYDFHPLQDLLSKRLKLAQVLEQTISMQSSLQKEIADFKAGEIPDMKTAAAIGAKRTQLEIFPGKVAEIEEKLLDIGRDLETELQRAVQPISDVASREIDQLKIVIADGITSALGPHAVDTDRAKWELKDWVASCPFLYQHCLPGGRWNREIYQVEVRVKFVEKAFARMNAGEKILNIELF